MIGYFNTYVQKYWEDNRKVQTYTELGLSLLLLVIFFAFAIRPTLNTVLELNKKKNEALTANKRLDEKIQSISLAQANLQEVEPKLDLVNAAVPQEKLILDFLNQAQLLGGEYNVTLKDLDYSGGESTQNSATSQNSQSEPPASSIQKLTFNLAGSGSYADIKAYTARLESLPRLAQINSISLTRAETQQEGEGKEPQDALNFKIEGTIYYTPRANGE